MRPPTALAERPTIRPPTAATESGSGQEANASKLEQIARRKDRDLSYVIRKAIDEYIEQHQHDPIGD